LKKKNKHSDSSGENKHLFDSRSSGSSNNSEQEHQIPHAPNVLNLANIAGVIDKIEIERLKRMIFRASRGNVLVHTIPLDKPIENYAGEKTMKDVYIVTFQEGTILRNKLTQICNSFTSDRFQLPSHSFSNKLADLEHKIEETKSLITITK
jgi:V-type H+-transporting ATPase subunit a